MYGFWTEIKTWRIDSPMYPSYVVLVIQIIHELIISDGSLLYNEESHPLIVLTDVVSMESGSSGTALWFWTVLLFSWRWECSRRLSIQPHHNGLIGSYPPKWQRSIALRCCMTYSWPLGFRPRYTCGQILHLRREWTYYFTLFCLNLDAEEIAGIVLESEIYSTFLHRIVYPMHTWRFHG